MTPALWIQLALFALVQIVTVALAWGRLAERDRLAEKTAGETLAMLKGLDAKIDAQRERAHEHETRITTLNALLDAAREEVRALKAAHDAHVVEDRAERHKLRDDFNSLSLRVERASSNPPMPAPSRRPR